MSVDLTVRLANGGKIDLPLAGQRTAEGEWAEVARNLGLKHYNGVFPIIVEPENIDEVLDELRQLDEATRSTSEGYRDRLRNVVNALEKVRTEVGWRAMIG